MKVVIYTRKPFIKTTFCDVVSIVQNKDTIGFGRVASYPIYYPKSVIKKVKVILNAKD